MKPLKPSMREKKRYLLIHGEGNLKNKIHNSIRDFIGSSGMTKVSLSFIKSDGNSAIISINREMLNQVRAAICIFSEKMEVIRVSGTLKSLRN